MGTLEGMRYKESANEQRDKSRGKEYNDSNANEPSNESFTDEQTVR
jgi:hypothetical protein